MESAREEEAQGQPRDVKQQIKDNKKRIERKKEYLNVLKGNYRRRARKKIDRCADSLRVAG